MREVYIFDIDGCVMPPIFTNFNKNELRKKIVEKVNQNGNDVKLYPSFIEFYKKHCVLAESIYFITGRKYSEFGKLTENQLHPLTDIKSYHIIYYPEKKEHKIKKYFTWKVMEIKRIISNTIKKKISQQTTKFNIYDDMDNYFPKIRKIKNKWKITIHLTHIDSKEKWNYLI